MELGWDVVKPLTKIQTDIDPINRLQDQLLESVNPLIKLALVNGVLISNQTITAGTPLSVSHKLVRNYQGWFIAKTNANSVIWESTSTDPSKFIVLNASANVTVSLWVF